jgi:hypothetical protein
MTQFAHTNSTAAATHFTPFQAKTEEEEVTVSVTRKMLQYHIIRVQLEGAKPHMSETERQAARKEAIEIRRAGFREEQEGRRAGHRVSYDDELLRREGTRIAYLLAREATEEAARHEEEIVSLSVYTALYEETDLSGEMRIAA